MEATYSPHVTETVALYRGLLLASDIGVFNMETESDAAVVVDWVAGADYLSSEVGLILADIRLVIQNQSFCSVRFVPRKVNSVAPKLALCLTEGVYFYSTLLIGGEHYPHGPTQLNAKCP